MSDLVYLGSYTEAGGRGLMAAHADPGTGALAVEQVIDGVPRPSFVAAAPGRGHLYAVSEVDDGQVFAFAIGAGGSLRPLNHQPTGGCPAHLSVHPSGRHVLSANYFGGSVAVHPVGPGGALGPATDLVEHPGADPRVHQVVADPEGRFVLAVDLGTDTVHVYRLDLGTGRLRPHSAARMRSGAGPRHLAFHPGGRTAYVINELDSTITVCAYDPRGGRLSPGQTLSTVPAGAAAANYPGEILVSSDGRYVYGSNRGHDSIAVLATGEGGRRLRLVTTVPCGGEWPRHMDLDGSGRLLHVANQRSGLVSAFRVEGRRLTPVGDPLSTPAPACILHAGPLRQGS